MDNVVLDILAQISQLGRALTANELEAIMRAHNQGIAANEEHYSKRRVMPYVLHVREQEPERWASWNITPQAEALLLQTLRMKPRRTASGVATITVITKPWTCSGTCIYCPNDVRMPKSYLHNEPACQRAEQNCFDPYLQVTSRLRVLASMGHITDKVELIVLGGTWNDYPESYRIWFVHELFRAINDAGQAQRPGDAAAFNEQDESQRRAFYHEVGISNDDAQIAAAIADMQQQVNSGELTHTQAVRELYLGDASWQNVSSLQTATLEELEKQHARNVNAAHRNVGLVIETRPDSITVESLALMRRLGCTKIQMGVQSLNPRVLEANQRNTSAGQISHAFELCRLFGFKSHAHFMANLLSATPAEDAADYRMLMDDDRFKPDEVKMYPCALIDGTELMRRFRASEWAPYGETELVGVLADNVLATPPYTRISRMIRDFSSSDIVCGNKKINLREVVEQEAERIAAERGIAIQEIRHRELAGEAADRDALELQDFEYATSNTREHFLQWVTPEGKIAGFLRLSLPNQDAVAELAGGAHAEAFPISCGQAMIREVHVYGKVAALGAGGQNAQHLGLGTKLVQRACEIAAAAGYESINVISAIGTRGYYARLSFQQSTLYQTRQL